MTFSIGGNNRRLRKLFDNLRFFCDWHQRRFLAKLRHFRYRIRWKGSVGEPTSLITVDPKEIEFKLVGPSTTQNTIGTYILDGKWDQNVAELDSFYPNEQVERPKLIPFDKWSFYTGSKEHFVCGIPWEETDMYNFFRHKCSTKREVEECLEDFEYVYEKVQAQGYKTQRELLTNNSVDSYESRSLPGHDEVCVAIGRDGGIYHTRKGNHRMVVAKVLGLNEMPVRVLLRHKQWQKKRHELYKNADNHDITDITHPDLIQLLK